MIRRGFAGGLRKSDWNIRRNAGLYCGGVQGAGGDFVGGVMGGMMGGRGGKTLYVFRGCKILAGSLWGFEETERKRELVGRVRERPGRIGGIFLLDRGGE